jgi:hypothetical protein
MKLTDVQVAAIEAGGSSFWRGAAGTGKTTALQQRLLRLLEQKEPAYTLMVLVAEQEHQQRYEMAVRDAAPGPYADLTITTFNRLAMDMTALFWPLVAGESGFTRPYQPPTTLTYDLAQLLMWRFVEEYISGGAFADLRLRPQQIVSQVLDTLNRAALNGLALDEAIERQMATWSGEPGHLRNLQDAGRIAEAFRAYCLENSLLDLSLTIDVFNRQLVHKAEFHRYFSERYRHLLVDNLEEQTPAGQQFIESMLPLAQTLALVYDEGGGYKRFMAADPAAAARFQTLCQSVFRFEKRFQTPPALTALANTVENYLQHTAQPAAGAPDALLGLAHGRYQREMINDLVQLLDHQIARGVQPSEIAIIAPYLDGAMRYMLAEALQEAGIPYRMLRRRGSPREEPRVRAWLTWLALAFPAWGYFPTGYDVAEALTLSIAGLDPARAQLVVKSLYRPDELGLRPVSALSEELRDRIGAEHLQHIEALRLWLAAMPVDKPLDSFLYELFMQLLAQPGFQNEPDLAGAAASHWLVETAIRLRNAARPLGLHSPRDVGLAFIEGINHGLVSANPPDLGDPPDPEGVTISTIYVYLLAGKPVRVQVWLEAAATGWWDIPRQPLSNAFVLRPSYDPAQPWTATEDLDMRNELLSRLIRGLTARTQEGVIIANSDLDRRGAQQEGALWRALQPVLPKTAVPPGQ